MLLSIILILAHIVLLCAGSADAAGIVLITRSDIAPYQEFVAHYQAAVKKYGTPDHSLKVFSLPRDGDDLQAFIAAVREASASVVVCVGAGAADFCREQLPGTPRICGMIPSHRDLNRVAQSGALGISMDLDPAAKFEALRKLLPNVKTIGAVYDPDESGELVNAAASAARRQGMTVHSVQVTEAKAAPAAAENIMGQVDAFMLFYDRTVLTPQTMESILNASFFRKVPVVGFSEKYVSSGALMALEPPVPDLAREAWNATELCLASPENCRGMRTAKTPGRLIVNKKIAEKLGVAIPEEILGKSRVIE